MPKCKVKYLGLFGKFLDKISKMMS